MIRTLQKKFVITAMTAITVLILILLGAINLSNLWMAETAIGHRLQMISDNEGNPPPPRDPFPGGRFLNNPKNEYDIFLSSNFFMVRLDSAGNLLSVDVSRTSAVTEKKAADLAAKVYRGNKATGRMGRYRYRASTLSGAGEVLVFFLDCSDDRASYLRVLLLSAAVGIACWGLMLLLVIMLSKKAIRPVAENIEKQKQFVTNAGHEIKTPLAIIQSNTEALELYQGESKWSRNIKDQTMRLDGLMKNLLQLSKMEERKWKISFSDFSYTDLLQEVLQEFVEAVERKGIQVQKEISPDLYLRADRNQIRELLSILIDNAVKYTEEGGLIGISLQRQGRQICLRISNTCESLPKVLPDKLFDRFYRADDARTQKDGSYGIGLSMARSLAEANHGVIHAAYIQPNRICFSISL